MVTFPGGTHPLEQRFVRRVLDLAETGGFSVYLVGGYIRDALSGRLSPEALPKDFDFAVAGGRAIALAEAVAGELGGHFVLLDDLNDVARVVLADGVMLDFAGCVGGTIESDVMRRDFTINALAWDPARPDEVIDLVGGAEDLKAGLVRAISEENLVDDPLRMLRAFRFAATTGGEIHEGTLALIGRHAEKLKSTASERVCYELFVLADSARASALLKLMGACGLIEAIFPELTETKKVTANAYHHLGLWDHSLEAVVEAEAALLSLPSWVKDNMTREVAAGVSRRSATKIATLLHDIGKPGTWEITPEGRHTFYGHDRLGAEMAEDLCRRMRMAKPLERFIVKLIRWHLRPGQLFHQGPPTDRAVHRFYRTVGEDVPPLMVLAFGDLGATRGPGLMGDNRQLLETSLHGLLHGFTAFLASERAQVRFLDGNDIMRLTGLAPGPLLGELLEALTEAQGLGEVKSRADAERFVKSLYSEKYSSQKG